MKSELLEVPLSDCKVYLESPVEYDECVVSVESVPGFLLKLTDERRDGKCIVEFAALREGTRDWKMSLDDLRALLEQAEKLLVSYK